MRKVSMPQRRSEWLAKVPGSLQHPKYNGLEPGVVQLGTGNFALSLMGDILHDVARKDPSWGMVGCSCRTDGMIHRLQDSGGLYLLVQKEHGDRKGHLVGSIVDAHFGPDDPSAIANAIADARTKLVTVTVSEKGYYVNGDGRSLEVQHDDVKHDLTMPLVPRTIYPYLLQGLLQRSAQRRGPIVVMSLDNAPENSARLQAGLVEFAERAGHPEVSTYLRQSVDFPDTVVDRITPQTNDDFREEVRRQFEFESPVVVGAEQWRQLVVRSSRFKLPPWGQFGVKTVDDVRPYFVRKFHYVNGGHQVIAIPGQTLGATTIHAVLSRHPAVARLLERAHDDLYALMPENGTANYAKKVRQRFGNPDINDGLQRVTAGTTVKVSNRLLSAVEWGLTELGNVLAAPTFVAACWLTNLSGKDQWGQYIPHSDPVGDGLLCFHERAMDWVRRVRFEGIKSGERLASVLAGIGQAVHDQRFVRLAANESFIGELGRWLVAIDEHGVDRAAAMVCEPAAT